MPLVVARSVSVTVALLHRRAMSASANSSGSSGAMHGSCGVSSGVVKLTSWVRVTGQRARALLGPRECYGARGIAPHPKTGGNADSHGSTSRREADSCDSGQLPELQHTGQIAHCAPE